MKIYRKYKITPCEPAIGGAFSFFAGTVFAAVSNMEVEDKWIACLATVALGILLLFVAYIFGKIKEPKNNRQEEKK